MPRGGKRRGAGAKPKPTELKVIQGTWRKDRDGDKPLDVDALEQETHEQLDPFPWLSERECELWALALERFGGWTKTSDTFALAGLVGLLQLAEQNREARAKSPRHAAMLAFKRRRDGNVSYLEAREHPLVIQQLRIIDALRKWLVEFGATPASRTQMREDGKGGRGAAPPPVDPFEAYLARKRG